MWKVYFVALMHLSINKWILVAVLKHRLGIQVIWELDIEFHFLFHCSIFTWCQARLLGPDLREREKKGEIKPRLIQKLESGSVLSNPGNAFPFLIYLNHTPVSGQPYFEQGWMFWCLLSYRTIQERCSFSPRWGVSGRHCQHTQNACQQVWAPYRTPLYSLLKHKPFRVVLGCCYKEKK